MGLSDHTMGVGVAVASVAIGATVVEKHFTFSRLMYGSDARHSMEPDEFKAFCHHVKEAAIIRANPVDKDDLTDYRDMKRIFEKSVVTARAVHPGQYLQVADLAFKKPGDGIPAAIDCDDMDPTLTTPRTWYIDYDGDGFGDELIGYEGDACPSQYGNSTNDRYGCVDDDGDGAVVWGSTR